MPSRRSPIRPRTGLAALAAAALLAACFEDTPTDVTLSSHLRVVHASPDAPALDLLVDSQVVVAGLNYRAATGFLPIQAGARRIRLRPAGTVNTVLDLSLPVEFPRAYSVFATGALASLEPLVAPDTASIPVPGQFKLRFIQAAPSIGPVDVYVTDPVASLAGATPVAEDVLFRGNTEYVGFAAGRYRIRVTDAGTTTVLLDLTQTFGDAWMRTVVATDAAGGGGPLVALLLLDY